VRLLVVGLWYRPTSGIPDNSLNLPVELRNLVFHNIPNDRVVIPPLGENAKHLKLEAVNTESLGESYFRKIKLIRYNAHIIMN